MQNDDITVRRDGQGGYSDVIAHDGFFERPYGVCTYVGRRSYAPSALMGEFLGINHVGEIGVVVATFANPDKPLIVAFLELRGHA